MVKKAKDTGTEEKILAAARKVFTTKGMAGARMQDIADEAGMNKALLHYYFRDKEKLFETVFLAEAQKFFPTINAIFASEQPLFEKIETFVSEYIDEMLENPYLPWFVINEINRDPDQFMYKIWGKDNLPKPGKLLEEIETLLPQLINKYTENLSAQINIEKIVSDKVSTFSSDKLEAILVGIMSKEFRFVEIIGGVLGFLIGLLQVIITLL